MRWWSRRVACDQSASPQAGPRAAYPQMCRCRPSRQEGEEDDRQSPQGRGACRQSPRLAKNKAPSTRRVAMEDDPDSNSSLSPSLDSPMPDPSAHRRATPLPESSAPAPPKIRREPSPSVEFSLESMLIAEE